MSDLSKWNIVHRLLFSILVLLAVLFAFNQFLLKNQKSSIQASQSQLDKQKQEYVKNVKLLADLPVIEKEVDALQANLESLLKYLPSEVSMPQVIDSVYQSGKDNNVIFDQFRPDGERSTGGYYLVKPITIATVSGYVSLASFVQSVASLERIVNVHEITINANTDFKKIGSQGQESDKIIGVNNLPLDIQMILQTYIFSEDVREAGR